MGEVMAFVAKVSPIFLFAYYVEEKACDYKLILCRLGYIIIYVKINIFFKFKRD